MYKYYLHVHTNETSECSKVKAIDAVRAYKEKGFSGIVITDHYYKMLFDKYNKLPWQKQVDRYLSGFRAAFNEGLKTGLHILLGMELTLHGERNDYLLYGFNEDLLYNTSDLYMMTQAEMKNFAAANDLIIYQAHPFRRNMTRSLYVDGIEVYNGHSGHQSNNEEAYEYAKKEGLLMISGTDFHNIQDTGNGGVLFKARPRDEQHLCMLLRACEYELIGV